MCTSKSYNMQSITRSGILSNISSSSSGCIELELSHDIRNHYDCLSAKATPLTPVTEHTRNSGEAATRGLQPIQLNMSDNRGRQPP